MMRHVAANALTLLILALVVAFGLVTWGQSRFQAPGPLKSPVELEVERGESLASVADKLADAGAISSAAVFRVGARYANLDAGLRYGEYSIPAGASMRAILELLNRGGNVVRQVVVPEGLTSWQVVELLRSQRELAGEIAELPPEGSLAPAGYDFQRGEERQAILGRMQAEQAEIVATAWAGRAPDLPLRSPEELLTLASIVEKETGVAEERPLVASVFVNRLRRGMRLQTDPSVIYGITRGEGTLGRGLRASELATVTPYNTYAIAGLPPPSGRRRPPPRRPPSSRERRGWSIAPSGARPSRSAAPGMQKAAPVPGRRLRRSVAPRQAAAFASMNFTASP